MASLIPLSEVPPSSTICKHARPSCSLFKLVIASLIYPAIYLEAFPLRGYFMNTRWWPKLAKLVPSRFGAACGLATVMTTIFLDTSGALRSPEEIHEGRPELRRAQRT